MKKSLTEIASFYRKRFGLRNALITSPPALDTSLIIVIPVYDEPDLLVALQSLAQCDAPVGSAEVIVVVNSSGNAPSDVKKRNLQALEEAQLWAERQDSSLRFYFIHEPALPAKHAGVGLARKIGMDEALYRFSDIEQAGAIVCLDADCTVAQTYLQALERTFSSSKTKASAVYFEHSFELEPDILLRQGIIEYELFLRYYIQALRYSGFPFAFHTIGSSMAVRADVYALQGGMNKRKAGEDFYFLHKLMPLGGFAEVNETTVFPSCRVSHRVPFGTGRAQQHWLEKEQKEVMAYHPSIFESLKQFLALQNGFWEMKESEAGIAIAGLPRPLPEFLESEDFLFHLAQMQQNAATLQTFRKRFFGWLDGFRVLKLVHWLRDKKYGEIPVTEAASALLRLKGLEPSIGAAALLCQFRRLDNPSISKKVLPLFRRNKRL